MSNKSRVKLIYFQYTAIHNSQLMPDCIFKFPPCFSTVHSILDDPGREKRYVTKLNETSHLLSYSLHVLSVPCFLMGSYLGHPCFVTLDPRNVTAISDGTACGIVALHGRVTMGTFSCLAMQRQVHFYKHCSYIPIPVLHTCLGSFLSLLFTLVAQWTPDLYIVHPAGNSK